LDHARNLVARGAGGAAGISCGERALLALALSLLPLACAAPQGGRHPPGELDPLREAQRLETAFHAGRAQAIGACAQAASWRLLAGDTPGARRVLDEGLALVPGHPDLLEMRGNVLAREGFRRAAASCFSEVLAAQPGRTSARLARGRLRLELGLSAAAREDLERCLESGEDSAAAWLAYAQALTATGDARRAVDAFARAFDRGAADLPDLVAAAQLVVTGRLQPRHERDEQLAASWLRRAQALAPDAVAPCLARAHLHHQRDELEAARACLDRALELQPGNLEALTLLLLVHEQRGDPAAAAAVASKALESERDPRRRALLEELCGRATSLAQDARP